MFASVAGNGEIDKEGGFVQFLFNVGYLIPNAGNLVKPGIACSLET